MLVVRESKKKRGDRKCRVACLYLSPLPVLACRSLFLYMTVQNTSYSNARLVSVHLSYTRQNMLALTALTSTKGFLSTSQTWVQDPNYGTRQYGWNERVGFTKAVCYCRLCLYISALLEFILLLLSVLTDMSCSDVGLQQCKSGDV